MTMSKIEICLAGPSIKSATRHGNTVNMTVKAMYYFRVKASNGKILCHSEVYKSKASVRKAIRALRRGFNAPVLTIVDLTKGGK